MTEVLNKPVIRSMKWINDCNVRLLAFLILFFNLNSFGQSFNEVAAARNAQVGTGDKDGGVAWADLNQDGFLDLLINTNNTSRESRLLFWNSSTNQYDDLTATHASELLLTVCERSALTGDFDNDGDIDFMRSNYQRLEIYENLGPLAPTPYSFSLKQVVDIAFFTGPGTQGGMNNEGLAWMDFDGDGDLDIYMEDHQYGQDILENNGTGTFTHYTPDSDPKGFPTTGSSGDYSVTADLDDNGDVDIVARREGTSAALDEVDIFMNNSDGTFSDNNSLNLETRNGFKGGVAVADFDNDGDFDYFWTNNGTSSGNVTHVIAEQTGLNSGSFALAAVTITPAPSWTGLEIEGIAMGDVNNDGKVDIFLASDSGAGYLLINNTTGGGNFSFAHNNAGINLSSDGEGTAFGDYDNDGDLDLYVNVRNSNNQLWENDLGGNTDYLKVVPQIDLGGGLTRSATGATAVLELKGCTDLKFIQEVSGGIGHGSQNDPRLHFGLPSGPDAQYKVTVSFVRPNGGGRTVVEKYVTPSALPGQMIQILDTDVSDPNAHPNAVDDSFDAPRNSSNNLLDVLNNDTDPHAEDLAISLLNGSTTQGGTVTVNDNGTPEDPTDDFVAYTPPADFSGVDNFTYHVTNQSGFCSSADVNITVNTPPNGDNNTVVTNEDVTYEFSVADFSVNYTDPETDPFEEIRITSLESVGDLLYNGLPVTLNQVITTTELNSGLLTFESLSDDNGIPYDSFEFEVGDGVNFSLSAFTLTINVIPVDDLPISSDKTITATEDVHYIFSVSDFSFSRIKITRLESVGELLLNGVAVTLNQVITISQIAGDQLVYISRPNENGSPYDSFDFEVGDDFKFNPTDYTVTINVLPSNDPPDITDLSIDINEDVKHVFNSDEFSAGYSDVEGDPLVEIRITSLPATGTLFYNGVPVTINEVISLADVVSGLLTFEPLPGESGVAYDNFQFEVGDGTSFSNSSATFTINVNAVNDIPVASNDAGTVNEDEVINIDILSNDELGDLPVSVINLDNPTLQGGSVVINDNGTPNDTSDDYLVYAPSAGFNGVDTFTYTIEDIDGESSTATVTITVNPVNDVPVAIDDIAGTIEETSIAVDVLANDNLGDQPTLIGNVDNSTTQGGTAVINNNGTPADPRDDYIDYTPAVDFNGTDTFTYTIRDIDGETSTATVTITVTGVNDTPLAVDDNASAVEDLLITIDVLSNDNLGDIPTPIISVDAISAAGGAVQINDNGTPGDVSDDTIDFTPANGFTGTDTFTYTIEDADGEQSTATVTVDISLAPGTLVIYKGFSPNGDGSNDEWVIDGILFFPGNTVRVFNRWGNLVYQTEGYDNQTKVWFGQSNQGMVLGDNILPDGTYFYMVDLGDGTEAQSGYVMLKR
jgi:gliding motility-associated-like protein